MHNTCMYEHEYKPAKQRVYKEQETGDGPCKVTACGPNTTNSQEGSGRGSSGSCQGLRLCKHRRSQTHACCRQHVQTEEVLTVMLLFWRMAPEVRREDFPISQLMGRGLRNAPCYRAGRASL